MLDAGKLIGFLNLGTSSFNAENISNICLWGIIIREAMLVC